MNRLIATTRLRTALWLLVCVGYSGLGLAQEQERPRPDRPGMSEPAEGASDRRRERLERQLVWLAQRQEAIRAEIQRLDEGGEADPMLPPMPGDERREPPPSPEEARAGIERVMADMDPEVARRIRQTLDEAERHGEQGPSHRAASRIMPKLAELARLRDRDPEMYQAKREEFRAGFAIMRAARDVLEQTDPAETEVALRRAIEAGLDAQTRVTRLELERLEQRVTEIREKLAEAERDREGLVSRRVAGLLERIRRGGPRETPSEQGESGDD